MKKFFKYNFIFLIFLMTFISGCNDLQHIKKFNINQKASYDIYINSSENSLLKLPIKITNNTVSALKLQKVNFEKNGFFQSNSISIDNGKVYCPIYKIHTKKEIGKELIVISPKVVKSIKFKNNYGPNYSIMDTKKNKLYIEFALGTPIKVIDTVSDKIINSINIKGNFNSYAIKDKYLYIPVCSAGLGYKNIPENYIIRIDRDSNSSTIINKKGLKFIVSDLQIHNNKIYMLGKEHGINKLYSYTINGNYINSIKIKPVYPNFDDSPTNLLISNNGIAYIQRNFGNIIMYDINKSKFIGKINKITLSTSMALKDHYLFVGNRENQKLYIVNLLTNKILKEFKLNSSFSQIKIEKHY